MPLDFIAIDFETANPKRASVIQIGVARVRGGQVVNTHSEMIRPPAGFEEFSYWSQKVHGLGPKDLDGAREWAQVLRGLVKYANGLPLVGHNVAVERSCIVQATEASGLQVPTFEYLCTQKLAQAWMPAEPKYKLDILTERLGLPRFGHHDAGEDAVACANLTIALADRAGVDDVHRLWAPTVRDRHR